MSRSSNSRLPAFIRLVRIDRPIGFYLLLWPTLWALWFAADGVPRLSVLAIFLAGVTVMRMAGCVINDYTDRHIDPHVERTRNRPLATGEISPREALLLFVLLLAIAFVLVLLTNPLTIRLSFVGAFLALTYPLMKRYTFLPQLYLGAAFGWAVPMAYAAQAGSTTPVTWLLFVATVLWATVYDTMYAMVDRDDDRRVGVKSTAILFGELDRLAIGMSQALMLATLYLAGERVGFGHYYRVGLAAAALLCIYHQWLIRHREPAACFKAFLNNHYLGIVVLVGIVLDTWLGVKT